MEKGLDPVLKRGRGRKRHSAPPIAKFQDMPRLPFAQMKLNFMGGFTLVYVTCITVTEKPGVLFYGDSDPSPKVNQHQANPERKDGQGAWQ
jgi:hypothetical protein